MNRKRNIIEYLILTGFAFIYQLSCLNWLKILKHHINFAIEDSDVFLCMGKFTQKGLIPYKDVFDHKGPVIVLINWVISQFHNSEIGYVWVLAFFMAFTLVGANKILKFYFNRKMSMILTLVCLLIIRVYGFSNMTETYCLPFLMWSIYFAIKYLKSSHISKEHNVWYSFFYGITFMVCTLTRLTNAIPLCVFILVGFVVLIKEKQGINLLKNILFFIIGATICFLPFLIYFYCNDAVYDMLYATILYNIEYTVNTPTHLTIMTIINHMVYVLNLFIAALIIAAYNVVANQQERKVAICVLLASMSAIGFQLQSRMYSHYLIIYIPILVVAIGLFPYMLKDKKMKIFAIILLVCSSFVILYKNVSAYRHSYYNLYKDNSAHVFIKEAEQIKEKIPEPDRKYVIAYNTNSLFYLCTDIVPCYKNFILQDWQCSFSDEMRKNFEKDIMSLKAKYIVLTNGEENNMDTFIYQNYEPILTTTDLILMRKK